MKMMTIKKGEAIIDEGTQGTCAYIIESGKVEVSRMQHETKVVLTVLGEKEVFGEMGLIEDKPRSATVTTLEDTVVRVISRESFNSLFEKNRKVILSIVKALFVRLRAASNIIAMANVKRSSSYDDISINGKVSSKDNKFLILSGLNEKTRKALDFKDYQIREFPFKLGRSVGATSKQSIQEASDQSIDILSDNQLFIEEDEIPYNVSKNHMSFDKVDDDFVVVDRGSKNGVIVNGMLIKGSKVLDKDDNTLTIGITDPFEFRVEIRG